MTIYITATFEDWTQATAAIASVASAGFAEDDVDVIMSLETQRRLPRHVTTRNGSWARFRGRARPSADPDEEWVVTGPLAETLAAQGNYHSLAARRLVMASLLGMSRRGIERLESDIRSGRIVVGIELLQHERVRAERALNTGWARAHARDSPMRSSR